MTKLLIKRASKDIPLPQYETKGAAGLDLPVYFEGDRKMFCLSPDEIHLFHTGLYMQIPEGYEGQVRPRSGLACKHGITVINSPGTIDSDYRGEIIVGLVNMSQEPFCIRDKMRIAQLVIAPVLQLDIEEVTELGGTQRGEGAFGSTGFQRGMTKGWIIKSTLRRDTRS